MDVLQIDTGLREYPISGAGKIRFNPADPGVYARFLESIERFETQGKEIAKKLEGVSQNDGAAFLRIAAQADQEAKATLTWVFGPENDFNKILGGVSLFAIGDNGRRVFENLFEVLQPILMEGAEKYAREQVQMAVSKASSRRGSV